MLPRNLPLPLMTTQWASQLDPIISLPPNQGILLKNIVLINGVNVVNHKLQRMPQGYIIIDQDALASIYRSAALNSLTLTLTSNAAVTLSLWVF